MKILHCKRRRIYDIGFIDPYYIHEETVKQCATDTQNYLVKALRFHWTKREILFSYNFE